MLLFNFLLVNNVIQLYMEFFCDTCNYKTCDKSHIVRHMKTKKHNNDNNYIQNTIIKPPLSSTWYKLDNDIEFYWNIIDKDNNNNDKSFLLF